MKRNILLIVIVFQFVLNACTTDADDKWSASEVCLDTGTNLYGEPNRGTFVDARDGQVYEYTTIGDQVWMAKNLNYNVEYSMCYDNNPENCEIYGRLYSLHLNGENSIDSLDKNAVTTVCPEGWRLPNEDDFKKLLNNMDHDEKVAARQLMSTYLWSEQWGGSGTNDCGFNALPSGFCFSNATCYRLYIATNFSSISMINVALMNSLIIENSAEVGETYSWNSIRCIKE